MVYGLHDGENESNRRRRSVCSSSYSSVCRSRHPIQPLLGGRCPTLLPRRADETFRQFIQQVATSYLRDFELVSLDLFI